MIKKTRTHSRYPIALTLLLLVLLGSAQVALGGNIDPNNKYAWGTDVGWINFDPQCTGCDGVTVYSDHLAGYAWGENIGWIRMSGTAQNSDPYGVSNDGCGSLSDHAWGTNVGWINFNPTHGGVTVDPVSGDFDGYAWGENVGWIHFQNASPPYKVNTNWHGDLTATYQNGIAAIIKDRATGDASSSGLTVANSSFLNDSGDCIILGHNNAAFANVTAGLPGGVDKRWARIWQLDVNDGSGTTGGNVVLTFDISEAGGKGDFSETGTYSLLQRGTGSSAPFVTVTVVGITVSGDQLTFTVDASNLGSEFTLGATAGSPTAVGVQSLGARGGGFTLAGALAVSVLLALGTTALVLWRRPRAQ